MSEQYPVRYVAFVDILGFRELITRLDKDAALLDDVCKLLSHVHRPREELGDIFKDSDFKVAKISDALAMSAAATPAGLGHIFAVTEMLANKLVALGYFIRGAVVKDRLFHNEEMVLGAGLVRAYSLESSVAVYPRVMLPREIVQDVLRFNEQGQLHRVYKDCFRRSTDGPHYLHLLRFFERVKKLEGEDRKKLILALSKFRDLIEQRLNEAVDTPTHYQKVHWFAGYWNDVFYGVDGLKLIEAPGLEISLTV